MTAATQEIIFILIGPILLHDLYKYILGTVRAFELFFFRSTSMLSAVISMGNLQKDREYLTIFLIFESERFPTNLRTLSFETTVHRFLRRSRTPCSFVYRSIKSTTSLFPKRNVATRWKSTKFSGNITKPRFHSSSKFYL